MLQPLNRTCLRRFRQFFLLAFVQLSALSASAQPAPEVTEAGIRELQLAMDSGTLSAEQLVRAYLARIEAYDALGPALNSIIRINPDALHQARALDEERRQRGVRGPLHGIPVIVKDNYNVEGMPVSGGSIALADFMPLNTATQVRRLTEAGAIVLAKANLHEFAYGITSISSLGGQTRNPYDPQRVPGGSSGGTAAAIAASFASFGMGSDTCGSIRIPAAFNNLVGLRPTKGLSSIHGIMPLSSTQDVAGPLARSTHDLALVLDAVSGFDPADEATALMQGRDPLNFVDQLGSVDIGELRIGRLSAYYDEASPGTRNVLDSAFEKLVLQGAEIIEINIPQLPRMLAQSGLIGHEFEADFNRYLQASGSSRFQDLEQIVATGLYHNAVHGVLTRSAASEQDPEAYQQAIAARTELKKAILAAMAAENIDFLAYPPIAVGPVRIGDSQPGNNCSLSANSGLPALSIPVGFTADGLPVGLELLGPELSDAKLLSVGYSMEQAGSSRQTPHTTPPLRNGRAPVLQPLNLNFELNELKGNAVIGLNRISSKIRYEVMVEEPAIADILAISLHSGPTGPVLLSLAGPGENNAIGEAAFDSALRTAVDNGTLILKLFTRQQPEGYSIPVK